MNCKKKELKDSLIFSYYLHGWSEKQILSYPAEIPTGHSWDQNSTLQTMCNPKRETFGLKIFYELDIYKVNFFFK